MRVKSLPLAAIISCAILATASMQPVMAAGRRPSDLLDLAPQVAQVTQVIDGATIQVTMNGQVSTVHYIGVNAPALNACMGAQARNANAALVLGQTVRMESDAVDAGSDGSLWRYVYLLNATSANEQMIAGGYARAVSNPPNIKNQRVLNDLEQQAATTGLGGWTACGWKSTVVKAPGACVTIPVEVIASRMETVPEITMLHDGDCVTILKAANADGPEWSGRYIYHPAGTIIPLSAMYLRWKDGVVPVTLDSNGNPLGHVVRHTASESFYQGRFSGRRQVPVADYVQIQPITADPGMPSMLQIQNPRTWLLQDQGNGQVKVLIDAFVYKSGTMNDMYYGPNGTYH